MNGVLSPYSTVLLASYGGPRQPEDVLPSMRSATTERGVPDRRLLGVSWHYQLFDGHSPISERNETPCDTLAAGLKRRGCPHPVVIGSHNWTPFFTETVSALHRDRYDRVVALTTVTHFCYSTCRQYREGLAAVMEQIPGVVIDRIGPYSERDGFVSVSMDALIVSVRALRSRIGDGVMKVLLVIHSTLVAMNAASANSTPTAHYDAQHIGVASRVAETAEAYLGKRLDQGLVYCSRSDGPHISWPEPDASDRLTELTGVAGVVAAPIGFISDHMEIACDLDTQAHESTVAAGFGYERAATAGIHLDFVATLADFLLERAVVARGGLAPSDHPCLTEPTSCYLLHSQKGQTHVPSASHTH